LFDAGTVTVVVILVGTETSPSAFVLAGVALTVLTRFTYDCDFVAIVEHA